MEPSHVEAKMSIAGIRKRVTAAELGKLQKQNCRHFLNNGVNSHVQKNKLLFVFCSWGGQTNTALYNEELFDERDERTLQWT